MAKPHNTIPPHAAERPHLFWQHVNKVEVDKCWRWRASISRYGYGVVIRNAKGVRTKLQAHRLAYFLHYGVDPKELCVCHTCDNRACCNPYHLFLGTILDNTRDMWTKGRQNPTHPPLKQGESHGCAKLTESQVKAIRADYKPFVRTYRMLAREYGISSNLVNKIVNRHLWKHID